MLTLALTSTPLLLHSFHSYQIFNAIQTPFLLFDLLPLSLLLAGFKKQVLVLGLQIFLKKCNLMSADEYISKQPAERQKLMSTIHAIILRADKSVEPVVEPMMGKEMIVYKAWGTMKYALSSVAKHMSLHALPIYGSSPLHSKYKNLLNKANFQKGCINFKNEEEMPAGIVNDLIADCAPIDLLAIRAAYMQSKKEAAIKSKKA